MFDATARAHTFALEGENWCNCFPFPALSRIANIPVRDGMVTCG
jgi:hypothetical protein